MSDVAHGPLVTMGDTVALRSVNKNFSEDQQFCSYLCSKTVQDNLVFNTKIAAARIYIRDNGGLRTEEKEVRGVNKKCADWRDKIDRICKIEVSNFAHFLTELFYR